MSTQEITELAIAVLCYFDRPSSSEGRARKSMLLSGATPTPKFDRRGARPPPSYPICKNFAGQNSRGARSPASGSRETVIGQVAELGADCRSTRP